MNAKVDLDEMADPETTGMLATAGIGMFRSALTATREVKISRLYFLFVKIFVRSAVAQLVERPSQVPIWCHAA